MSKEDERVLSRYEFILFAYRYDYGSVKLSLEKQTIRLTGN